MKKNLFTFAAAAAVATLLLSAVSACTKDKAPDPSAAGGCYVTVSVGLPDTKAEAVPNDDGSVYTLHFTEGDKLFVHGSGVKVSGVGDPHLAGYLLIDADNISDDGRHATFSGELTYYDEFLIEGKKWYQGRDLVIEGYLDKPWTAFSETDVRLIPANAGAFLHKSEIDGNYTDLDVYIKNAVAASLGELLSSAADVSGSYDATRDMFTLNRSDHAVFDISVKGLQKETTYGVFLFLAPDEASASPESSEEIVSGEVFSNADGIATFAISAKLGSGCAFIVLRHEGDSFKVDLCTRDPFRTDKVYCAERKIP